MKSWVRRFCSAWPTKRDGGRDTFWSLRREMACTGASTEWQACSVRRWHARRARHGAGRQGGSRKRPNEHTTGEFEQVAGCSVFHSESPLSTVTNSVATTSGDNTSHHRDRRQCMRSNGLGLLGLGVGFGSRVSWVKWVVGFGVKWAWVGLGLGFGFKWGLSFGIRFKWV